MMKRPTLIAALALVLAATAFAPSAAFANSSEGAGNEEALNEEAVVFEARSGEQVDAYRGTLTVPMNRDDPASGTTTLSYIRFPATTDTPGNPIVYLSGGPGGSGSGTAKGPRFPLFMAMRQHGDVIAFDQRGTGQSQRAPNCTSSVQIGEMEVMTDEQYADAYRRATRECAAFWAGEGVDLGGFTTVQSAHDLADLREHLGAEKVSLWAISYGSHLAMAAMEAVPGDIDRVIMASAEGLDQTVKLPARTVSYFNRLQAAVDAQAEASVLYPDILGLMARVQAKLTADPMTITVPKRDGGTYDFLLQGRHLQEFSSGMIADPNIAALMLLMYRELDAGETELATFVLQQFWTPGEPITLFPMTVAMDRASGISPARLAAFERQKSASPIGGYLNFPMPQILSELEEIDLGTQFRGGPFAETPVLLLTGTLDGRTYPEGQSEAVSGLTNVHQVIVENAGHNLFMTSPEVGEAMHAFMRGEEPAADVISVEAPDFSKMPDLGR